MPSQAFSNAEQDGRLDALDKNQADGDWTPRAAVRDDGLVAVLGTPE